MKELDREAAQLDPQIEAIRTKIIPFQQIEDAFDRFKDSLAQLREEAERDDLGLDDKHDLLYGLGIRISAWAKPRQCKVSLDVHFRGVNPEHSA
jgi:hypothetical protein